MKYVISLLLMSSCLMACDNQKKLDPIETILQDVKTFLLNQKVPTLDTLEGHEKHYERIFNESSLSITSLNNFLRHPDYAQSESRLTHDLDEAIKAIAAEKFAQVKR